MGITRACLVCGQPTTGGPRCPRHARGRWSTTRSSTQAGYGSAHRRARADLLRRHPICQCSGWCGKHRGRCRAPSTVRDHIINKARGGTDDPANEQALCAPCHAVKTNAEGNAARRR